MEAPQRRYDIEHRRRDETTLILDQQLGRGGGGDGRGSSRDECQRGDEDSHTWIPSPLLITAVVPRCCTDELHRLRLIL